MDSTSNDLDRELVEIEENLMRNELNSVEIGELANRRDEILEAKGLREKVEIIVILGVRRAHP